MNKRLLTLALVAALTSLAGNAKSAITLSLDNVASGTDSGNTYSYSMSKIWDGSQILAGSYLTIQDSGNTITSITSTGGVLAGDNGGYIQYVSLGEWTGAGDSVFTSLVNNHFSNGSLNFDVKTSGGPLTAGSTFAFLVNGTTYNDVTTLPVPEPSALSLLAVGLGGLAMLRRCRS